MLAPPLLLGAVHDSETDVVEAAEPLTLVGGSGATGTVYVTCNS